MSDSTPAEGLYLLHFDPPLHHARHYLGFSRNIPARIAAHLSGRGSPLVRAARLKGSTVTLVRTWPGGTQRDERRLKDGKNIPRECPLCALK